MMRLNLVLLVAVIASAMYLVQMQYQSRRLFVEVEKAQSLSRKLETERERLEVKSVRRLRRFASKKLPKNNCKCARLRQLSRNM